MSFFGGLLVGASAVYWGYVWEPSTRPSIKKRLKSHRSLPVATVPFVHAPQRRIMHKCQNCGCKTEGPEDSEPQCKFCGRQIRS